MDNTRRSRLPVAPLVVVAVVVVLLLPILYVLAVGPISALMAYGYIPVDGPISEGITAAYSPVRWLMIRCGPFSEFMKWYTGFWPTSDGSG